MPVGAGSASPCVNSFISYACTEHCRKGPGGYSGAEDETTVWSIANKANHIPRCTGRGEVSR